MFETWKLPETGEEILAELKRFEHWPKDRQLTLKLYFAIAALQERTGQYDPDLKALLNEMISVAADAYAGRRSSKIAAAEANVRYASIAAVQVLVAEKTWRSDLQIKDKRTQAARVLISEGTGIPIKTLKTWSKNWAKRPVIRTDEDRGGISHAGRVDGFVSIIHELICETGEPVEIAVVGAVNKSKAEAASGK